MARTEINTIGELNNKFKSYTNGVINLSIYDCNINVQVKIDQEMNVLKFSNCVFKENVILRTSVTGGTNFYNCTFQKDFDVQNADFKGNVRIKECKFFGYTNFTNTTFHDLADFWRSVFYQKTIFYKTDFLETVVFSGVTFKENVLFTYTLINKLILFRGTRIKKGFDLSLAILSGEIGVYDFKLKDFDSIDVDSKVSEIYQAKKNKESEDEKDRVIDKIYENVFEKSVFVDGVIPIKNKRETFRILKKHHENQSNIVESLPFKYLEKHTYKRELIRKLSNPIIVTPNGFFEIIKANLKNFIKWISYLLDYFILQFNGLSNRYGIAYFRGFTFTLSFGFLFFYLSLINTDKYTFGWDSDLVLEVIPFYVQSLLPTHDFGYMGESITLTAWFYVFDFIGRIFVGYGIYQTIQAFRKFR